MIEFLLNLSNLIDLLLDSVFLTDERFLHVYLIFGLFIFVSFINGFNFFLIDFCGILSIN